MSTDTFQLFFALLALVANAAVLALVGARVVIAGAPDGGAAASARNVLASVAAYDLSFAWLVALTCTLGSLYFSEVANFPPCTLCWYQRIAMYPLAVVLGIAAVRRDREVRVYVWPMVAIGAAIAIYHYLLERFPDLETGVCDLGVSCGVVWFTEFGFVTLPYMALSGFLLIAVLLLPVPHQES